jgi:hypothetical protein
MNSRWQSAAPPAVLAAEPSADDPDVRWLSYSQIAALRGISRASAERMVRKHRWRRTVNNHGVTVAAVPVDYAEPSAATPPEQAAEPPADRGVAEAFAQALAAVEAARSAEASALRERAEVAEIRADRADAALAAERQRADELRLRVEHFQAEASEALDVAERARTDARDAQEQAAAARSEALEAEGKAATAQQELDAVRAGGRLARAWRAWRRRV